MQLNNFYTKGQSLIGIVIVLVVAGLFAGGLYFYLSRQIPEVTEFLPEEPEIEKIVAPELEEVEISEIVEAPEEDWEIIAGRQKQELKEVTTICQGLEEKYEEDRLTSIFPAEYACYLIEAVRRENNFICSEIFQNDAECECNAAITFFGKNLNFKKVLIDDKEKLYTQILYQLAFINLEFKEFTRKECLIDIEKSIAELVQSCELGLDDREDCYFLLALWETRKDICNNIVYNECQKCSCYTIFDFLEDRDYEKRKEIFGENPEFSWRKIKTILNHPEIRLVAEKECPCLIEERKAEIYSVAKMEMKNIASEAWKLYPDYSLLNCEHENLVDISSKSREPLCDYVERYTGNRPIIYATKREYCAYVKVDVGNYFCIDAESSFTKTVIETNIDPSISCNGISYICPRQ